MICLDASVASKLFLREEHSDRASALYISTLGAGAPIVAPSLLLLELTNIVRQQMRGPRPLGLAEARQLLAAFLALSIEIHSPPGMHQLALEIADAYNLPATYDAHYLALAEALGCEFWTDDRRLLRQVRDHLPLVRWLGEYVAPAGA